jgi:hypothetical protein
MTKEKEIQILQSLKGDTYFAQMFGDDIDRMCENISMDIAIECGCKFNTKAEILQKELKDLKEKAKTEMLLFACSIISALSNNNIEGAMVYAEKQVGIEEIIKFKHSNKIELSEKEISYLVSKLK